MRVLTEDTTQLRRREPGSPVGSALHRELLALLSLNFCQAVKQAGGQDKGTKYELGEVDRD